MEGFQRNQADAFARASAVARRYFDVNGPRATAAAAVGFVDSDDGTVVAATVPAGGGGKSTGEETPSIPSSVSVRLCHLRLCLVVVVGDDGGVVLNFNVDGSVAVVVVGLEGGREAGVRTDGVLVEVVAVIAVAVFRRIARLERI